MHHALQLLSRISFYLPSAAALLLAGCSDTVEPPPPVSLAFTVPLSGTTYAGSVIAPAIKVSVLDKDGQIVASANNQITLEIANNPGGGVLSGKATATAVDGIATFDDISVNRTGGGYTLLASSPGLTPATSNQFTVLNGPDARIVFTSQPVSGIANVQIPSFTVTVQDVAGNTNVASSRTISLFLTANSAGASLTGVTARNVANGSATFSSVIVTKPGRFTINAASPNLPTIVSEPFDMIIGPATHIAILNLPSIARVGEILPVLTVAIRDDGNNAVVTGSHNVSVSLAPNSFGGSLTGTTTAVTSNGIATFPGLSISAPAAEYRIAASAPSIPGTSISGPIAIRDQIPWNTVTSGYFHTCGRAVDGKVYCWGTNLDGQLGMSGGETRTIPAPVASSLDFISISAGRSHTCGLVPSGAAYCWGLNSTGQVGPNNAGSVPTLVSDAISFASIHAGYSHTCGLDVAGKAYCWGSNAAGELGAPTSSNTIVAVSGGLTFSSITAGRSFTCGLTVAGAAYCRGENFNGELGDGSATDRSAPTPVGGGLTFSYVQADGFHSCGLTPQGKAYCWGQNSFGQLGDGRNTESRLPVAVLGSLTFASLSVGNRHNCGVTTSGVAYCWGDNSSANLGDGTTQSKNVPTAVNGSISFVTVSAGRFHTCGITVSNDAYCWGENASGQLGNGTTAFSALPVLVR